MPLRRDLDMLLLCHRSLSVHHRSHDILCSGRIAHVNSSPLPSASMRSQALHLPIHERLAGRPISDKLSQKPTSL